MSQLSRLLSCRGCIHIYLQRMSQQTQPTVQLLSDKIISTTNSVLSKRKLLCLAHLHIRQFFSTLLITYSDPAGSVQ
uniref:Uncharacterized protein n=1 Tax=Anguilla anguilla TaxID=7936 RepID=A0A0E9X393_ANGAN